MHAGLLSLMIVCSLGPSALLTWSSAALLPWKVFRGRRDIYAVFNSARRLNRSSRQRNDPTPRAGCSVLRPGETAQQSRRRGMSSDEYRSLTRLLIKPAPQDDGQAVLDHARIGGCGPGCARSPPGAPLAGAHVIIEETGHLGHLRGVRDAGPASLAGRPPPCRAPQRRLSAGDSAVKLGYASKIR